MQIKRYTFGFIVFVVITMLSVSCSAVSPGSSSCDKIFVDSCIIARPVYHHHFDGGVMLRVGRDRVRTYDDYDHITSTADNFILGEYSRFLTLRVAHGIVFKKVFEAGITYSADIYIQPHDVRAFIPLMLHVMNNTRLNGNLALLFTERAGYAFYVRSKEDNPFLTYRGVEGGFASETLVGLSVKRNHGNYLQILLGYRFQHIYSKAVFYPDQSLIQQGGVYGGLPAKITEISNGLYHCIYFSLGVPF